VLSPFRDWPAHFQKATGLRKAEAKVEWPASAVETWALDKIKPYERNAREHPPSQIELLAKLMLKHGVDQPIVVDEDGVILKGHGRRLAAIKAGFKDFPVIIHRGLSDIDKRAIRIADNKVALLSDWDETVLRLELDDLKMNGFDIEFLGFDERELADLNLFKDLPTEESSSVVPGTRGVSLKFDMMPNDRAKVITWLAYERDARKLRTTAEALIALAGEAQS
jgi:hypothetical protein